MGLGWWWELLWVFLGVGLVLVLLGLGLVHLEVVLVLVSVLVVLVLLLRSARLLVIVFRGVLQGVRSALGFGQMLCYAICLEFSFLLSNGAVRCSGGLWFSFATWRERVVSRYPCLLSGDVGRLLPWLVAVEAHSLHPLHRCCRIQREHSCWLFLMCRCFLLKTNEQATSC